MNPTDDKQAKDRIVQCPECLARYSPDRELYKGSRGSGEIMCQPPLTSGKFECRCCGTIVQGVRPKDD
jgi:hypothetical protein